MTISFLLIDDEPAAESFSDKIANASSKLQIDSTQHRDPEDIIDEVSNNGYDGILMDIELTRVKGLAEKRFSMEGTALTQQIRTKSNQIKSLAIPIVSFSYDQRYKALIGNDTTSGDLFDMEISKQEVNEQASEIAARLIDLVNGYGDIANNRQLTAPRRARLFGLSKEKMTGFDQRVDRDLEVMRGRPVHNIAQFFAHALLKYPGPLISTDLLLTRLGVAHRGASVTELLQKVPRGARYRGVFSKSNDLWWMYLVDRWWSSLGISQLSLRMLDADTRVKLIRERFGLRSLRAIQSTTKSPGKRFWKLCAHSGVPVDPTHAYALVDEPQMKEWHDQRMLSRNAALRYIQSAAFASGEKERIRAAARKKSR